MYRECYPIIWCKRANDTQSCLSECDDSGWFNAKQINHQHNLPLADCCQCSIPRSGEEEKERRREREEEEDEEEVKEEEREAE